MSKFTFFTILFALIIIIFVGQMVLKNAIFPEQYQTAVLQDEDEEDEDKKEDEEKAEESPEISEVPKEPEVSKEVEKEPSLQGSSLLNTSMLKQVGFQDITESDFSGRIFDLFDIQNPNILLAAVFTADNILIATELKMSDEISAQELYKSIQNKTKVYIDLFINETNSYGDRAFYINHRKKQNEVFLVVRMKNYLYTFAYDKSAHPRIKTLISFLYTDILDQQ